MDFNQIVIPLVLGFILDSILGDPLWLPHPIRLFGNMISYFESKFNTGSNVRVKGGIISILLIVFTYLIFYCFIELSLFNIYTYYTSATIFVFYGLANRSLIAEALKVENVLTTKGVEAGRKQLSFIVGRDTSELSENKIRTAVLETLAENLSDGIIAPLFYYAIGGVPLMLTYKMVNTLDSMIGYKNDRYREFGFFAAKFDDVVNFIPARITAILMVAITLSYRGLIFLFKFGNKHASPNAGFPESALAGILDCQFGGPNIYHGKLVEKPFIGYNSRNINTRDLYKSLVINYLTSLLFVIGCIILIWFVI